jgi:hypothetical protein
VTAELGSSPGAQVLVLHGSNDTAEAQQQQQQQVDSSVQRNNRPATPDTTNELPIAGPKAVHSPSRHKPQQTQQASAVPSKRSQTNTANSSSSSSSGVLLTWQQLYGLRLLVASGTCHREVAAALVEGGAKGPADFLWGQQLRHYYQEATGQLQVGWLCCCCYCWVAAAAALSPLAAAVRLCCVCRVCCFSWHLPVH